MATKRLIDAWDLIEWLDNIELENMHRLLRGKKAKGLDTKGVRHMIDTVPTVDAVEVVHGYWVSDKADILFHCSECETQISTGWDYDDLIWNYCPNCGAKMDGAGNGN